MSRLNAKSYAVASIAAFAAIFAVDFLVHGILLKPTYEATQHLWRRPEDCVMWSMLLGQILMPFVAGYIFTIGREGKGIGEGLRYGVLLGTLFVPGNLIMYAVQPLPALLVATWIGTGFVQAILLGVIFAALYKPYSLD